jgi:hypothetical protein
MWLLFLVSLTQQVETGAATVYWTTNAGKHIASCNGKDPKTNKRPCRRCFFDHQSHIAHRSLPLGTAGLLCSVRTGRCVRTVVRDRGPYSAKRPCWQIPFSTSRFRIRLIKRRRVCYWLQTQIKLQPGWKRRGNFDLTRPVARAIGHKAFEQVTFTYKGKSRGQRADKKTRVCSTFGIK